MIRLEALTKEDNKPVISEYWDLHSHKNKTQVVPINFNWDLPLHTAKFICRWLAVDCALG